MKKILCFISVLAVMMFSCVTASAVGETKFKLKLVSQSDTQAVLSFNHDGGSAVAALDFDVIVNESKLKVTKIADGDGLRNAKIQASAVIGTNNADKTPASVSLAMVPGYRNVNDSDMYVITVKKLVKGDISADDIEIKITNCENDQLEKNVTTVTEDFSASGNDTATEPSTGATNPSEGATDPSDGATKPSETPDNSSAATDTQSKPDEAKPENQENAEDKGINTTAIIIICAVVVVAGGAAAAVVIIKKKKTGNDKKEG